MLHSFVDVSMIHDHKCGTRWGRLYKHLHIFVSIFITFSPNVTYSPHFSSGHGPIPLVPHHPTKPPFTTMSLRGFEPFLHNMFKMHHALHPPPPPADSSHAPAGFFGNVVEARNKDGDKNNKKDQDMNNDKVQKADNHKDTENDKWKNRREGTPKPGKALSTPSSGTRNIDQHCHG